ncbi:ribbon-helix-helix protein, CopG family [Roseospira marina]|uniref:Ribbon-helix-helix protein, CopG family n=1 Tax=Roseospira marina TaxID=140057 RepID=A0A5M6IGR3_9PROT|nr:ribbon-helix-helix protein, CopG family [Roseospira marina]KAA5607500.1 ribbon-helix-helix protein, CopG family [Roseospira marina]MBB4312319.1 putative transcriptional regulator [Roseospira marina]MBB5085665.1 putative transcriptional regulator [Roseospira marina]
MTEDSTLTTMVPPELLARVRTIAKRSDREFADCVRQAVTDFCETWELYHETVDSILRNDDERPCLRVANS